MLELIGPIVFAGIMIVNGLVWLSILKPNILFK
jgi:hypothetical protein